MANTMAVMTDEELHDAVDGLSAHDLGALDSGVSDSELRERVRDHLAGMQVEDVEQFAATFFPTGQGYGDEDVDDLRRWLRDEMGVPLHA